MNCLLSKAGAESHGGGDPGLKHMDVYGLTLLCPFLTTLAPTRKAGGQTLGAGMEGRDSRRCSGVWAHVGGRESPCGDEKKDVLQKEPGGTRISSIMLLTAGPDHTVLSALSLSWTSLRPERGQGRPRGAQSPLSFSRGTGF